MNKETGILSMKKKFQILPLECTLLINTLRYVYTIITQFLLQQNLHDGRHF